MAHVLHVAQLKGYFGKLKRFRVPLTYLLLFWLRTASVKLFIGVNYSVHFIFWCC